MNTEDSREVISFIAKHIMELNFRKIILKKAVKKFDLTEKEALLYYQEARKVVKKQALNKGIVYLLLGVVSLIVGGSSLSSNSTYILWGTLFIGIGMTITALGMFRLAWS